MAVGGKGVHAGVRDVARRLACVLAAFALALALGLFGAEQSSAAVYPDGSPSSGAAAVQTSAEAASAQESDGADQPAEGEAISDDEVPMAGGLGGSEPMAVAGANIQWIVIGGIVLVVVFFGASTLKVNRSINSMKDRMR